jgi:hypothetical protein
MIFIIIENSFFVKSDPERFSDSQFGNFHKRKGIMEAWDAGY